MTSKWLTAPDEILMCSTTVLVTHTGSDEILLLKLKLKLTLTLMLMLMLPFHQDRASCASYRGAHHS